MFIYFFNNFELTCSRPQYDVLPQFEQTLRSSSAPQIAQLFEDIGWVGRLFVSLLVVCK
jgi:hypothetical protein